MSRMNDYLVVVSDYQNSFFNIGLLNILRTIEEFVSLSISNRVVKGL